MTIYYVVPRQVSSIAIYIPTHKIKTLECVTDKYFSYFSTKTYVVGTQKNRLNETFFFEHPKQMLKIMGKKIFTILL